IGNPAGHACGHNQIGPANVGAALAARESMLSLDISGELVVLGCPAEEIVWGKIALLKLGGFDGIDAILTSHGDYQNGAISRPCQSVIGGEFVFYGESGHGGKVQKRNALDAAELAVQSIERLRAHHFADTGVEHVLRIGGHIPNVTPDEARLWISTRHEDFQQACDVYDFVKDVCDQAATMTKTTFQHQFISGTRGYLPNDTMAEVLYSNFEVVGPPKWSESDISWMQQLVQGSKSNSEMTLDRELGLYKEGVDPFGQDDGEASWRIPLARANWAIPLEVPFHNWTCTALSGHPASHAGPLAVSEALALTALDLFSNPSLVDEAKEELNRRRNNHTIDAPMLGAFETMTTDPKSFWDGSWRES
ncbi:MAG: peptidase dimerization domain-containing protein, partial [Gammaproteobacteria bacterium]|nr:peptidase dimerization domain-containing protein [Gammaproteobacteria bacterium]